MWHAIIRTPTDSIPIFKNRSVQSHVGLSAQDCWGLGKTFRGEIPAGWPWPAAGCHSCRLRQKAGAAQVPETQGEGMAATPVTAAVLFGVPVGQSPQKAPLGCGVTCRLFRASFHAFYLRQWSQLSPTTLSSRGARPANCTGCPAPEI